MRVRNRIASIKKVITILSDTGISSNSDDTLKQLFKKFDDTMLATKGDVAECLNNFIENTWNDIEAKYIDIKEFYAEDELSFNKTWDGFEKEGEIDLLIKNYKTVRNANVLPQILTVKFEEIVPKLNKCHNEIAKLHSSEIKIFDEVKEILAEQLDIDPETIEMTSNLQTDLGADSLDAIDIVMSIEDQYGIEVPDSVIENMRSVEDIVSFIENNVED